MQVVSWGTHWAEWWLRVGLDFFKVGTLRIIRVLCMHLFLFLPSLTLKESHRWRLILAITATRLNLIEQASLVGLHLARWAAKAVALRSTADAIAQVAIDLHRLQALADLGNLRCSGCRPACMAFTQCLLMLLSLHELRRRLRSSISSHRVWSSRYIACEWSTTQSCRCLCWCRRMELNYIITINERQGLRLDSLLDL